MAVTGSHARRLVAAMPMLACALLFGFLLAIRISAPAMAQSTETPGEKMARVQTQQIDAHEALLQLSHQVEDQGTRISALQADAATLHAQLNTASAVGMAVVAVFGIVATLIFKKGS